MQRKVKLFESEGSIHSQFRKIMTRAQIEKNVQLNVFFHILTKGIL